MKKAHPLGLYRALRQEGDERFSSDCGPLVVPVSSPCPPAVDHHIFRPLLLIKDVIDVDIYQEGNLVVRRDALLMNDVFYDCAIAHQFGDELVSPRFYAIPFLTSPSPQDEDIFRLVFDHYSRRGTRRAFIRDSMNPEPSLVEVTENDGRFHLAYVPYHETSLALLSEKPSASKEEIETLVQQIRQWQSAYRGVN